MAVVVVGMHERDAPLEVFEKVAVGEHDLRKALAELSARPNLSEVVILSTCLRTEIYAVVERFHDGVADLESYFRGRLGAGAPDHQFHGSEHPPQPGGGVIDLGSSLSCRYDDAAIRYLFEVAAGIDSPVLGEGEILRQVRDAVDIARSEQAAGPILEPLFRHAVEAGKRARTETAIQRGTTSLAHAGVELGSDRAHGFDRKRILLVGAGEMGAGIARALSGRGDLTGEVVVANRGVERRAIVSDLLAARAVDLTKVAGEVAAADVIFTSTAADDAVLGVEVFAAALEARAARGTTEPLVVVDIAVPRDVDPAAGDLEGVIRLDVEDVRRYAEEQMASRASEVPRVRTLLAEEMERYRSSAAGRLAAPVVAALRERAESLRVAELARYETRLVGLDPEHRQLIDDVTRRVIAKLLHDPTVRVKEAAGSPRGERLAEALRALFDL